MEKTTDISPFITTLKLLENLLNKIINKRWTVSIRKLYEH